MAAVHQGALLTVVVTLHFLERLATSETQQLLLVCVRMLAFVRLEIAVQLMLPAAGPFQSQVRTSQAGLLPFEDAASVERGERIYADSCAACHGAALEGEQNWKQRKDNGRMPAPPHDVSGHTWHHADDVLIAITKFGTAKVVGQGYESDMPGFEDSLSDQNILDVLGFIKSTWPDEVIERHSNIGRP